MAIKYKEISVKTFFEEKQEDLRLELLAGAKGLEKRKIITPDINRPGMALAGFTGIFLSERIQIIGRTEISYLKTLDEMTATRSIKRIFEFPLPCIVVTKRVRVPKFFFALEPSGCRRYYRYRQYRPREFQYGAEGSAFSPRRSPSRFLHPGVKL